MMSDPTISFSLYGDGPKNQSTLPPLGVCARGGFYPSISHEASLGLSDRIRFTATFHDMVWQDRHTVPHARGSPCWLLM